MKHGNHYYFQYNSGLKSQSVEYKILKENHFRINQTNPLEGTELLIDPTNFSQDGTAAIGSAKWSRNGQYMAYTIKRAGSDWETIHLKDVPA